MSGDCICGGQSLSQLDWHTFSFHAYLTLLMILLHLTLLTLLYHIILMHYFTNLLVLSNYSIYSMIQISRLFS